MKFKLLIIFLLSIFLSSCFTIMYTDKTKQTYNPNHEILPSSLVDTNYIVKKEKCITETNLFEGVYIGKTKKKRRECYNFQFTGMLEGENRIFDMYIPIDNNFKPIIYEVKKIKQGKPAFLYMKYCYPMNEMSGRLFNEMSDDLKNPDIFYNYINYDDTQIPDTTFIVALDYYYLHQTFDAITNIYSKNTNNSYSVKQLRNKDINVRNLKLEYKKRSRAKWFLSRMAYVGTVTADIITSPFQLIGFIYISITGIW